MTEPLTLYKLMILYMLDLVDFPLTNSQMLEFFLDKEYTDYFTYQKAVSELIDSGLLHAEQGMNTSRYTLTDSGLETLYFFKENISKVLRDEMKEFMREHRYEMRNRASISTEYYRSGQDYIARCQVKEGAVVQFALELAVPTEEQATRICKNWEENCQNLYANAVSHLLKSE